MQYIFIVLVVLAAVLVISMVFMTIYIFKSPKAPKEEKPAEKVPEIIKNDDHIKDFYDINNDKNNKVLTFDSFEGEVNTVGVDFGKGSFGAANEPEVRYNEPQKFSVESLYEYENDFRTVSFDDIQPQNDVYSSDTVYMTEERTPKTEVVLKYNDGSAEKIIRMLAPKVTVGRGVGNDLILSRDSFTSRNHAVFELRDDKLYIRDLNSKNGTFINKTERVNGEALIEESCRVYFGDAEVDVLIEK